MKYLVLKFATSGTDGIIYLKDVARDWMNGVSKFVSFIYSVLHKHEMLFVYTLVLPFFEFSATEK